ncbi:hypothetical protein SK128_001607 [Halocaridina rubra]|uniref:Uncharacterized protein n=1 Tax=Halocaridina rubra TaxID=373956 RepID=A0AAN9A158_HALRR
MSTYKTEVRGEDRQSRTTIPPRRSRIQSGCAFSRHSQLGCKGRGSGVRPSGSDSPPQVSITGSILAFELKSIEKARSGYARVNKARQKFIVSFSLLPPPSTLPLPPPPPPQSLSIPISLLTRPPPFIPLFYPATSFVPEAIPLQLLCKYTR